MTHQESEKTMLITRHEDGTVSQVGGVTRVTHGAAPQEDPAVQALSQRTSIRVGGTVTRFNAITGEAASTASHLSYQQGADRPNQSASVMQSLRTEGGKRTVELLPGDPTSRTLLSVALREGLVVETAPGVFVDRNPFAGAGSQEETSGNVEAPSGEPEASSLGIFDTGEMDIWSQEIAPIPQHSYDRAVAGVTAALATQTPERLDGVITALAESAGIEPERAREFIETGIEWHAETIARDLIREVSMTREQVDDLWEHLRTRGDRRLAAAIQEVTSMGQSTLFREMAQEFMRRQAREAAAAKERA